MNTVDCIKSRRSIRRFKPDSVKHSLVEEIISAASFSPSWKNTQITRYIAIEDSSLLGKIADDFTPSYNSDIIRQTPVLIAVTYIKGRCGFERDGSYTTGKKDRWQMFDAGVACQTFCLAAHEYGLGTVIMGVFDESGISSLLDIPKERELAALIAHVFDISLGLIHLQDTLSVIVMPSSSRLLYLQEHPELDMLQDRPHGL